MNNKEEVILLRELKVKYNVKDRKEVHINSSKSSYEKFKVLFENDMGLDMVESFYAMYLSRNNNVIGWIKISQGGIAGTVVDSKLVFSYGLNCLASSVIIAHNHPSGNLKPSNADLNITKQLKEAGKLLDVVVLDHLILSSNGYTSLADENLL